ncbi:MAG: TIGR04283 family arsenosugar biosynthesis glycosyltransferase [Hyphomonadaceae bacterium]
MSVTIIIPALDEAAALPTTLASLAALTPPPAEIILVDGGSTDDTCAIAQAAGIKTIKTKLANRAAQMNAGAAQASSSILCFLHADTDLPTDFIELAADTLARPSTALAGFVSIMRGPSKVRRVTTAHNYIKTWYAPLVFRPLSFFRGVRLLFGDQVMICRKPDFDAIDGFDPRQTIMEEADFCLRMVRAGRGRVRQIHRKVWSSDRRVAKWGPVRSNLTYLYIGMMWGLGRAPDKLARHYADVR